MRYLLLSLIFALFTLSGACAHNRLINPIELHQPQDAKIYLNPHNQNTPLLSTQRQNQLAQEFLDDYFKPWHKQDDLDTFRSHITLSIKGEQHYELNQLRHHPGIGVNFHPHDPAWADQLEQQMDLAHYANQNRNAIVVNNTALRALPTDQPNFKDFHLAGEGYPFDYLQFSPLWVGTPLRVRHLTQNGDWALVIGPTMFGWVRTRDIAYVSPAFIKRWENHHYVAITRNHIALKDQTGRYYADARLGTLLPRQNKLIFFPVKDANQQAIIKLAQLPANSFHHFPWRATPAHFATVINNVIGEPYGWGGLYGFRDCSQLMLDVMTPFGIHLPRNSASQLLSYHSQDTKKLNAKQIEKLLLSDSKPFLTLVGFPGHIMLYIGKYHNQAIVFHDKWGIQTIDWDGHKGRAIVGKAAITSMHFGTHVPYAPVNLLEETERIVRIS
ncbi:MAG: NlpC/P60 family N-terminal domain-containing protein [Gammaproteobacteria bacterium]